MKKCAFTGHRPQGLPFGYRETDPQCIALKKTLRQEIIRLIERENVRYFLCGMAIGIDMYAAEIVLELKSLYPDLQLEAAIPCEGQADKWSPALQARYASLRSKCDCETVLQQQYTSSCMQQRNRYMVNQADILLAVWNGRPSGTGGTVQFARTQGKPVIVIDPRSLLLQHLQQAPCE